MPFLLVPPTQLPALDRSVAELLAASERLETRNRGAATDVLQPNLVDFSRLDRLLQPIEEFRPAQQPAAAPSAAAKLSTHEEIVAQVMQKQMQTLKRDHNAQMEKSLDALWQDIRAEFLGGAPAPAAAAVVVANPVVFEETAKMSTMYQLAFETASPSGAASVEQFKKTSVNLDMAELWTLTGLLLEEKDKNNDNLLRPRCARLFLERQYRQVKEKQLGLPVSGGDLKRALASQVKNDIFALAFLLCRSGEFAQASELLKQEAAELSAWLGGFTKGEAVQAVAPTHSLNAFRTALENLANFHYELDPAIASSVEDFIWFRLCAVCSSSTAGLAAQRLQELSSHLVQCGPDYFPTQGKVNPFLYARYLFSCGELERALMYLAQCDKLDCLPEAVHLALKLKPLLRLGGGKEGEVDLAKLTQTYAQRFANPVKAMSYLTLCEFQRPVAKRLLVRNVQSSAKLLKVVRTHTDEEQTSLLATEAASEVKPEEAVNLYVDAAKLCDKNPESKLQIQQGLAHLVLKELCRVMPLAQANEERQFWKREALGMRNNSRIDLALRCTAFYELVERQDEDASVMELNWLIPTSFVQLAQCTDTFLSMDRILVEAFPQLVHTTLQMIDLAHNKRNKQQQAKDRLKLLVAFIAHLREEKYYLKPDVERELSVMESKICI